jgi:O-6-methylguanine DNA methyltransferase
MKKAKRQLKTKNFKTNIYEVVKKIPKGRAITYKKVAKLAGFPRAWRAVGNVLNKNKNPKIPCHRVIRSDGKIGGYNRGVKKKIALLTKEGIKIENKKVIFQDV